MRYQETGNVHRDFHLGTDTTIRHLLNTYDVEFLRELFGRTAREVYREIHAALKKGDMEPLLEHWQYFMDREGGKASVERGLEGAVLEVDTCPAVHHLIDRGKNPSTDYCLQTCLMNNAWAEGTPFDIRTVLTGCGRCRQIISGKGE